MLARHRQQDMKWIIQILIDCLSIDGCSSCNLAIWIGDLFWLLRLVAIYFCDNCEFDLCTKQNGDEIIFWVSFCVRKRKLSLCWGSAKNEESAQISNLFLNLNCNTSLYGGREQTKKQQINKSSLSLFGVWWYISDHGWYKHSCNNL